MKKQNSNFLQNKKTQKLFILVLFIFSFCAIHAQQTPTFDKNIIIEEDNGGTMIVDILYANNKLFVYSSKELLVYNNDGSQLLQTFELTQLGKFAPNYFNSAVWVPDVKLMAYNQTDNILYIVRTDLKIQAFGFDEDGNVISLDIKVETPGEIEDMKTLHGYSIIKYDDDHKRLYWVVQGRSKEDNNNGSFHVRETYLGIYKVSENGQALNKFHSEFIVHNLVGNNYTKAIYDVEFVNNNNQYYLARQFHVNIFNIIDDDPSNGQVEEIKSIPTTERKIGKLLYVNETNFHKVIAFPYRLPFWEPDSSYQVKFYVIDVDDHSVVEVIAPDRRMCDAVYLPHYNDLIICRNPVDDPTTNISGIADEDIAIYHWENDTFTLSENDIINTNGFPNNINPNTPIRMIPTSINGINNGVIISKKHEIVHLYKNDYNGNYSFNQKYSGINNFFFFSTQGNDQTFIINLVNNGIEKLDASYTYITTNIIKTAYPAFHIINNEQHGKLFFFHKLDSYNSGLYMYNIQTEELVNINDLNNTNNKVDKPIGDCIYNPYTNQILVSENAPSENNNGTIKCYNGTTGIYEESITITGHGYCKKMFIAPNGKLYLAANMLCENYSKPHLYIFDAKNNYQTVYSYFVDIPIPILNFRYFAAHFCYNPYNQLVYATYKPQRMLSNPYTPCSESCDSLFIDSSPLTDLNGLLLKLSNEILEVDNTIISPGKIICREPLDGNNDNNNGYLYILGDKLTIYNCDDGTKNEAVNIYTDITYSAYYDKLFAIRPYTVSTPPNLWSYIKVYEVYLDGSISQDPIYTKEGYVASFFINPYDNMLYLYHRLDIEMLGDLYTSLIQLDPENPTNPNTILLGNDDKFKSFGPEILQKSQTPAITPNTNKIYLPNGGHSSVSVVDFDANEAMYLTPGTNWISIPRHEGNGSPQYDPWPTETVFAKTNFETQYSQLSLAYNKTEATHEYEVYAKYNIIEPEWYYTGDMAQTYSYRGYKLNIFQENPNTLFLSGNVENPTTPIELYGGKDNWVGYFLYGQQDIFDALGNVSHYLFKIESEDWFCIYNGPYRDPGNPQPAGDGWVCSDKVHNIDYGQMVVLTTDYLEPGYTFTWQCTGGTIDGQPRADADYFAYTETADYTPITILLDSTENPAELGAFINDSCVGACIVVPDDTLVGIRAYMDGQAGDSLTFEEWYNTKSTACKKVNAYYVYNPHKQLYEQRTIKVGENRDYYNISFRKPNMPENNMTTGLLNLRIFPNPASENIYIEYALYKESKVNLEVFDIYGRKIVVIMQGMQPQGVQHISWDMTGISGQRLNAGIYTIRLIACGENITKKVVIN